MTSRPLLMKGPLVRRTLSGEKTETRRLVTSLAGIGQISEVRRSATPGYTWSLRDRDGRVHDLRHADMIARCPYGKPGDELWIRETWAPVDQMMQRPTGAPYGYAAYRADNSVRRVTADAPPSEDLRDGATPPVGVWYPAIFMPRVACRLRVRIVEVGIEPLQCISATAELREGVGTLTRADLLEMGVSRKHCPGDTAWGSASPRERFQMLWDLINGERPGARWLDDPYVWVLKYEVAR